MVLFHIAKIIRHNTRYIPSIPSPYFYLLKLTHVKETPPHVLISLIIKIRGAFFFFLFFNAFEQRTLESLVISLRSLPFASSVEV